MLQMGSHTCTSEQFFFYFAQHFQFNTWNLLHFLFPILNYIWDCLCIFFWFFSSFFLNICVRKRKNIKKAWVLCNYLMKQCHSLTDRTPPTRAPPCAVSPAALPAWPSTSCPRSWRSRPCTWTGRHSASRRLQCRWQERNSSHCLRGPRPASCNLVKEGSNTSQGFWQTSGLLQWSLDLTLSDLT